MKFKKHNVRSNIRQSESLIPFCSCLIDFENKMLLGRGECGVSFQIFCKFLYCNMHYKLGILILKEIEKMKSFQILQSEKGV